MSQPSLSGPSGAEEASYSIAKGQPTDEELAAVLAVLSIVTSAPERGVPIKHRHTAGGWRAYHRQMRTQLLPGMDSWTSIIR